MLQNIFSHRPPLYDVVDEAELYVLHASCLWALFAGNLWDLSKIP